MKDVLIVTSYYPPEIGAAANRIQHMAEGLSERGYNISVLTPLPNYPSGRIFRGFRNKLFSKENHKGVDVFRLWLFATNSKNPFLRLLAMISYSLSLFVYYLLNKIPKTVIVQSPPLLVAFTSMFLLRSKKRKLILNISDLWPSAGIELGAIKKGFVLNLLQSLEQYNYRTADFILGQSTEILEHVHGMYPEKSVFLYRNYPVFKSNQFSTREIVRGETIKMVYAGLLGIAQGILEICNRLDFSIVEFHIYGEGAERVQIEYFIELHPNLPIYYHGNLSRENLHKAIQQYDLALIPLKNRIHGSVPSKIFEYAKLGLPILYFGGGEGENIIKENELGICAEAGNYSALNNSLSTMDYKVLSADNRNKIKKRAKINFDLSAQLNELVKQL